MRRTIRISGKSCGFGKVLRDVLVELGFECSLSGDRLSIESAPLSQEVPKRRLMKVVKTYEDLYYNLGAADLLLSHKPVVDKVLQENKRTELQEYGDNIKNNPGALLRAVKMSRNVPASLVEAIYRFLSRGDAEGLKGELIAYLEGH